MNYVIAKSCCELFAEAFTDQRTCGWQRTLGPIAIWGLGVGYVISGMYFGWNLGLPEGGPIGLAVATLAATVLYIAFVLGYAELACALPRAGGVFVYASLISATDGFGFFESNSVATIIIPLWQ